MHLREERPVVVRLHLDHELGGLGVRLPALAAPDEVDVPEAAGADGLAEGPQLPLHVGHRHAGGQPRRQLASILREQVLVETLILNSSLKKVTIYGEQFFNHYMLHVICSVSC